MGAPLSDRPIHLRNILITYLAVDTDRVRTSPPPEPLINSFTHQHVPSQKITKFFNG